jgi:hypothetical protein
MRYLILLISLSCAASYGFKHIEGNTYSVYCNGDLGALKCHQEAFRICPNYVVVDRLQKIHSSWFNHRKTEYHSHIFTIKCD